MDISKEQIKTYNDLLDKYEDLDPIPDYMPTIFEISGYPHYEDVMSNVLRFFFSTDYDHGFSAIFVRALLDTIGEDGYEQSDLVVNYVEREYLTNAGNRIDLVIETETYCIAIEHKIYADLYNDLDEYKESIDSNFKQNNKRYIALCKGDKGKLEGWDDHQFKLVTYKRFFEKLEKELGKTIASADSKILMYISDYIKTIRNLNKRTNMTEEFLEFLSGNRKDIESLYNHAFKDFKKELKQKGENIDKKVYIDGSDFKRFHYNPQDQLKYVQGYRGNINWEGENLKLEVKLRLIPNEYRLELWAPNAAEHQVFQKFVKSRFSKTSFSDWKNHEDSNSGSIIYNNDFNHGENPGKVAKKVEELILKKLLSNN